MVGLVGGGRDRLIIRQRSRCFVLDRARYDAVVRVRSLAAIYAREARSHFCRHLINIEMASAFQAPPDWQEASCPSGQNHRGLFVAGGAFCNDSIFSRGYHTFLLGYFSHHGVDIPAVSLGRRCIACLPVGRICCHPHHARQFLMRFLSEPTNCFASSGWRGSKGCADRSPWWYTGICNATGIVPCCRGRLAILRCTFVHFGLTTCLKELFFL